MVLLGQQLSTSWFWEEAKDMSDFLRERPPISSEDQRLVNIYAEIGQPFDRLLYSPYFDDFLNRLKEEGDQRPPNEIVKRLFQLRKSARLPRLIDTSYPAVEVPEIDFDLANDLLRRHLGVLGSYEQLPYTPLFDQIWSEYNRSASKNLDRYQFWRVIARIRK
jgi:hypothetical protein